MSNSPSSPLREPIAFIGGGNMASAIIGGLIRQGQQARGGAKDIYYAHAYWQIAEDEAWVIEVTPPDCYYWNFQLDNWWMESLDYRFQQISVNKHSAKLRCKPLINSSYREVGSTRVSIGKRPAGFSVIFDTSISP